MVLLVVSNVPSLWDKFRDGALRISESLYGAHYTMAEFLGINTSSVDGPLMSSLVDPILRENRLVHFLPPFLQDPY